VSTLDKDTPGPVFGLRDPDARGYFGPFGGRFVPETLMAPVDALAAAYAQARTDPAFVAELRALLSSYVGRPTPLYEARRATEGTGVRMFLKREDLAHTGAHKINNALGQTLLAKRMGKTRIIAETGAGQHGVATATACALLGLECIVYMGTEDMRRQQPNVQRMGLLGTRVEPVDAGARTLKEAVSAAIRDWVANVADTHYIIGSSVGPAPFPAIVRDLQRVIGDEARAQVLEQTGRLPERVIACVGGGSNAIGIFSAYLATRVELYGVEAGGRGPAPGDHAARFAGGAVGVLHGTLTMVLQDESGQTLPTHSASAGLDYPAVGPEHASLHASGRVRYTKVSDERALDAFALLCETEGILPALESAHAVAFAADLARKLPRSAWILVNLSGRGDKDLDEYLRLRPAAGRRSPSA